MAYEVKTYQSAAGSIALYDTAPVAAEHHDWIAGSFIKTGTGEALIDSFEVKRGTLPKGGDRTAWASYPSGKTWQLITRGCVECIFQIDGTETMITQHAGEALLWDNVIPHKTNILEEVDYVCVRTN